MVHPGTRLVSSLVGDYDDDDDDDNVVVVVVVVAVDVHDDNAPNLQLTGKRSPGPTFNLPSLNSRSALFLSSDSPYTTEPSM